ncbi:tetratricopeptide repeat protein [Streptomyces asiaticus]|uniref:tetratricopeptide repeat protein n=1 Tax=Streptomyces asiaticus TaxID=114695 RepID=UPI0039BDD4F6
MSTGGNGGAVRADVVVLTALEVEYRAVRAHLEEPRLVEVERGSLFELGVFRAGPAERTVAIHMTGPGNPGAAASVERAAALFAPRAVLFVGVAGGRKDVALGDVVAADAVYDYETGKDTESGFLPRQKTYQSAYGLVQLARLVAAGDAWQRRIRPGDGAPRPRARVKPLAAGGRVVAHHRSDVGRRLAASAGDALAVDMEGFGFLAGAYVNQQLDALVIRGISDLLGDKDEGHDACWQPMASRHAAAFAFELISRIPAADPVSARPLAAPTRPDAPRTPAAWPHQAGVLPPRALSFQHRSEADQLRAAVDSGGTAVLTQVLTGTGGVGKTQLAADYARTAWDSGEVDVLVWISASSRSAITAGYARAGVEVLAADPSDPEQAARAFLAWLEPKAGQEPCRWLVVLDDVADLADMRGWWPPASRHGRALVTTRRREAALTGAGRRRVTVGLFTPQEAAAYFTAVLAAHDRHEPTDQINSLAADLGYLPLALAQAAAYIIDTDLTCASYGELLADRIRKLADLLPEPGALPDDQTGTVAAAWSLSIERANQIRPAGLARPMLQLAAFLDPNGIPATILTSQPTLAHLTEHRTPTSTGGTLPPPPPPSSAEDAMLALRALHRLSLIDHTPDTPHQTVRVHQLVQRATRDTLTPAQHYRLARTAADALMATWPDIERDTTLAQTLHANTNALTRHAEDALYQPAPHMVLFHTGRSLGEAGQIAAATAHFQRLTETTGHFLGPHHPLALTARSNLAHWRGKAGDAASAAAAFEELLADQLRVLGPDHPGTLIARSNLARWRGEVGDAAGAVAAFEELLADRLRVQGPDHPDTLTARNNLAHWRGKAGDAASAAAAFEELLADQLRVLGPDHPDTLIARNNLARWRGEVGDAAGAAAAFEELLTDQLRVLGPDHPHTLTARNNLAHWRDQIAIDESTIDEQDR